MNNLVPFIPSDPPPILNDNFDHESYDSEIYSPYKSRDSINDNGIYNETMDVDVYPSNQPNMDLYQYENYGRDNDLQGSRNPIEVYQYIENVIIKNKLRPDFTDSAAAAEDVDKISEKSFDGEFEEYINQTVFTHDNNEINIVEKQSAKDSMVANSDVVNNEQVEEISPDNEVPKDTLIKYENLKINDSINNADEAMKADDFSDFSFLQISSKDFFPVDTIHDSDISEINSLEYFPSSKNEDKLKTDLKIDNFADFTDFARCSHETDTTNMFSESNQNCINKTDNPTIDDFDDDFEDFATFENVSESIKEPENVQNGKDESEKSEETLNKTLESILTYFNSMELESSFFENINDPLFFTRPDSFISNQTLSSDIGLFLWKELINYDYSPAFIFQWMQSAAYEKFMASIGPEYKEMLSSHRATLPLFSVNLTPIEPVPADNCLPANVSASSSNIDLTLKDECGGICVSERNSAIDFKNLEEEFIFDKVSNPPEVTISDVTLTNSSSSSSLSSTVIQSERFGGILKSILKPLNSSKASPVNKPTNPQVEAVLKELPDLSYMSSKVLMFPVISTCDVEDNNNI